MKDIAEQRGRFGYRRIGLMLEREGVTMNHKKLYRLYTEERLTVKKRRVRKRATGTRNPIPVPTGRMRAGASISSRTRSRRRGAFASWAWWTTARAKVWA